MARTPPPGTPARAEGERKLAGEIFLSTKPGLFLCALGAPCGEFTPGSITAKERPCLRGAQQPGQGRKGTLRSRPQGTIPHTLLTVADNWFSIPLLVQMKACTFGSPASISKSGMNWGTN